MSRERPLTPQTSAAAGAIRPSDPCPCGGDRGGARRNRPERGSGGRRAADSQGEYGSSARGRRRTARRVWSRPFAEPFVGEMWTGIRRTLELTCLMAAEPSVLLLDEPAR